MSQPPQWQQDANRHTALVDPVVTIQELSRFKPLRATRIDHALVFTTAQGSLDTYLPPSRPSRTDLATRRWTSVYEVDMGWHEAATLLAIPSQRDAFLFEVSLSCTWQVLDPAAFVASGERNVPAMVQRLVEQAVRPVLRGFAMEDSAAAESHARKAIEATGPLGARAGLDVRCILQIRRDEAALEQERQMREIAFAREKLEPQHALLMREDELAAERALVQGRSSTASTSSSRSSTTSAASPAGSRSWSSRRSRPRRSTTTPTTWSAAARPRWPSSSPGTPRTPGS